MTPQEINAIIAIARRAPLANMTEAEQVAQLLTKLAEHFAPKPGQDTPPAGTNGDGD